METECAKDKFVDDLLLELKDLPLSKWKENGIPLRYCQYSAYVHARNEIEKYQDLKSSTNRSSLVQMATGTGKSGFLSIVSTCVPSASKILILTSSDTLRDQVWNTLNLKNEKCFWSVIGYLPKRKYTLHHVKNKHIPNFAPTSRDQVVVTTIHTLKSQISYVGKSNFDLIIFDEGHKKGAAEWGEVVDKMNAPVLLLTATPFRSDGRPLNATPIYKYTFYDALNSSENIVKKVEFISPTNSVVGEVVERLIELRKCYDLGSGKPKAMIRVDSFEQIGKITKQLNEEKSVHKNRLKVVAVHSRYNGSARSRKYFSSKKHIPDDYDIILHQDMLIEGFDDPQITILGLTKQITDGRVLIQLVGRATRYDKNQENLNQQTALVISDQKDFHDKSWKQYIEFERNSDDFEFKRFRFIPKAENLGKHVLDAVVLKPSIQLKKRTANITDSWLHNIQDKITYWFEKEARSAVDLLDRFKKPKTGPGGIKYSIFLFKKRSSPNFLSGTGIENTNLQILIISATPGQKHLLIHSSDRNLPKPLRQLGECSLEEIRKLLPETSDDILSLSLDNISIGKDILRSKTLNSNKTESHISAIKDGNFNTRTLTWQGERWASPTSVTISSRRITFHKKTSLKDYLKICAKIENKLRTKHLKEHRVFKLLAKRCSAPKVRPFYFLACFMGQKELILPGKKAGVYASSVECLFKANAGKLSCNNSRNGVSEYISISCQGGVCSLFWKDNSKRIDIFEDGEREDLLDYLNKKKAFNVYFKCGTVFSNGRFVKTRQLDNVSLIRQNIMKDNQFGQTNCKIEAGEVKNGQWQNGSIFRRVEDHLGNTPKSILICDDDGDEWADYVYFDLAGKMIIFIHCKHDGYKTDKQTKQKSEIKPGYRINSMYTVLGQAMKTAHFLWTIPDEARHRRWQGAHFKKRIKRLRNRDGYNLKEVNDLFTSPFVKREIWVIQPSLDINKMELKANRTGTIFSLVNQAVSVAQSQNAILRIYGTYTSKKVGIRNSA